MPPPPRYAAGSAGNLISARAGCGTCRSLAFFIGMMRTNRPVTRRHGCFNSFAPAVNALSLPCSTSRWGAVFFARTSLRRRCGCEVRTSAIKQNLRPKLKMSSHPPELARRAFLGRAVKGATLTALFGGVPKGWVGGAYASDGPEIASMNFGIIALTDCSPIVIAHEKGFFTTHGISWTLTKGANWAAI